MSEPLVSRTLSAGHAGHLSADTPDGHPGPLGPVSGVRSVADCEEQALVPVDVRASAVNPPDEWTALRAEFALYLIRPEKVPALQREWAEAHGIAEETASRWRQHPEVLAIVNDWRERLRAELGRVMANMVRLASTGDGMPAVQAARLLLETYGEMSPTRVDHTVTLASYVSGRLGSGTGLR